MKIMHLDASVRLTGSHSRSLSAYFVDRLKIHRGDIEVDRLDLINETPPHFGEAQVAAVYASQMGELKEDQQRAVALSDALCARVLAADAIVCGSPIYNFGIPSALKAFIDHISRSGVTFQFTEAGLEGRLAGKKAVFLISAGGNYAPGAMFDGLDCLSPQLNAILRFLGLEDIEIIRADPMQFEGPEAAEAAMGLAKSQADAIALSWVS